MLGPKILYSIYLLHASNGFKYLPDEADTLTVPALSEKDRLFVENRLHESGYLDASGNGLFSPAEISLFDLICLLNEKIDPCMVCNNSQTGFLDESLRNLKRVSSLWLKSIKLNQL